MPKLSSRRRLVWSLVAAGLVLLGAVAATVSIAVLSITRTEVVRRVDQPASVSYPDGRYHLGLRRYRAIGAPVVGGTSYRFWISQDPGLAYGHSFDIDATGTDPTDFTVEWAPEAVTIRLEAGQEVTIPARVFTGGR